MAQETQPGGRLFTKRAWATGLIGAALIGIGSPHVNHRLQSAGMTNDFSMAGAVLLLFLLALLNAASRALRRGRPLLDTGEMLVAFAMMASACAVATMGWAGQLVPLLGAPVYYASPQNAWNEVILPHTPRWLMLPTEGPGARAIEYFYHGMPREAPWAERLEIYAAWLKPLGWWAVLLGALFLVSISLMSIFRREWVERERIVFPLAQLPMELAGVTRESDHQTRPLLGNPLLWLGFAAPFIHCTLRALGYFLPAFSDVPDLIKWRELFLDQSWTLDFTISWQTVGLAFLLNTDVSLCVWFLGLAGSFYHGFSKYIGFASTEKLNIYGAAIFPDLGHFGMGAMIALCLIRMWLSRRRLIQVARRGLRLAVEADDLDEPMSDFAAFWGVAGGLAVMLAWLVASGFSVWIALVMLFAAFVGFFGLTRIVAESGIPVSITPLIASDFTVSAVGTTAIGRQGLVAMPWTYAWDGDVRVFPMATMSHGMKACSGRGRGRGLFWALLAATGLSLAIAVATTISFGYEIGAANNTSWFFYRGPQRPFEFAGSLLRDKPRPPDARGWIATGIGAAVMTALTFARQHFVWWPLNPVALPIAVVHWTHYLWFSIFLAWLAKALALRYGGPKLYFRTRPLFLGMVLGQYVGAGFWCAVHALMGVRGYWIFVL
jgi:hypothetical protein